MVDPRRWTPALAAALLAVLLGAGSAVAEPPAVERKRAEADRVLAQVREIDSQLGKAAEAYNLANIQLASIEKEQRRNARLLGVARTNLGRAQRALESRLVALYTAGNGDSTLEVLLGASSLDDMLDRLDAADRVSTQDAEVLRKVTSFRQEVQRQKGELARARAKQSRIVASRAAEKREVERRLAERQRLLSTIRGEIARLQRAEQIRQAALARQARARLAVAEADERSAASVLGADGAPIGSFVAPPARYGGVVGVAMQYLGTPYQWGGSSPSTGFDCSGFVMFVYSQVGVSLPHNAAAQYGHGAPVSRDDLQAGDIVFFDGLGHNGIYIGGGQFIHSPHTGDVVKISSLSDAWYGSRYVGARRL
jgi:cell wall-associated NlpC family hydrolase